MLIQNNTLYSTGRVQDLSKYNTKYQDANVKKVIIHIHKNVFCIIACACGLFSTEVCKLSIEIFCNLFFNVDSMFVFLLKNKRIYVFI